MLNRTKERTEALRLVKMHERLFYANQDHVAALKVLLRLESASSEMEDDRAVTWIRGYLDRHYRATEFG